MSCVKNLPKCKNMQSLLSDQESSWMYIRTLLFLFLITAQAKCGPRLPISSLKQLPVVRLSHRVTDLATFRIRNAKQGIMTI